MPNARALEWARRPTEALRRRPRRVARLARDLTGNAVDASHFLAEDEPDVVADHLLTLLAPAAAI